MNIQSRDLASIVVLAWAALACGGGSADGDAVPSFQPAVAPPPAPGATPPAAPPADTGGPSTVAPGIAAGAGSEAPPGVGPISGVPTGTPGSAAEAPGAPVEEPAPGTPTDEGPPPGSPVATHGQLRVEGTRLVDETGAPVQLRGVSTMWLNWEDRYSVNQEALSWMRDNWKVTVVRAAMGIEPEGAYLTDPEASLEQLRTVVRNAIAVGVYVIIDWHDHTAHEHREEAQQFFQQMATEFGAYPNVLYEPYNEPLNVSWSGVIKPYHEALLGTIRAVDPDNVVILGTRSWSQRVDEAAADRVQDANSMYTVHFYACDHREFQRNQAQVAYDAGLPLFVTEWGATPADGGAEEALVCEAEAQAWIDWLGERQISWAAWKLDGCNDSSCFFTSRDAPPNGGWTDEWLNGHARFVVSGLLQ